MARRRSKLELSLFPFLNILFGLIAVLILHIFFIMQMGNVEGSAIGRAAQLGRWGEGGEQLEQQLVDRLRSLEKRRNTAQIQRRQAEAELEQRRLLVELRKSQDLIAAAGKGTTGVPIGAPVRKEWRMIPITSGGGDNLKKPILVEVCADGYVVHHFEGNHHRATTLNGMQAIPSTKPGDPPRAFQADAKLKVFLDGIDSSKKDRYLLFLIRPEGIESYSRISQYCVEHYPTRLSKNLRKNLSPTQFFDFGYEPFSNQWLLVGEAAKP